MSFKFAAKLIDTLYRICVENFGWKSVLSLVHMWTHCVPNANSMRRKKKHITKIMAIVFSTWSRARVSRGAAPCLAHILCANCVWRGWVVFAVQCGWGNVTHGTVCFSRSVQGAIFMFRTERMHRRWLSNGLVPIDTRVQRGNNQEDLCFEYMDIRWCAPPSFRNLIRWSMALSVTRGWCKRSTTGFKHIISVRILSIMDAWIWISSIHSGRPVENLIMQMTCRSCTVAAYVCNFLYTFCIFINIITQ